MYRYFNIRYIKAVESEISQFNIVSIVSGVAPELLVLLFFKLILIAFKKVKF